MVITMRPDAPQRPPGTRFRGGTLAIFFGVLLAEIAGAYYFMVLRDVAMADALSKTANAYYVLLMDPPNLAAIGFVWNPLPSLIQIPILLFRPLWPVLATRGVAGGIMTSGFAAFNAAFVYRSLRKCGEGTGLALLLTLLFAFNPFMFYYGCNGMSEMPFFTSQLLCVYWLAQWYARRATIDLFGVALALACSFLSRYDTFALALALGICLVIIIFQARDPYSAFQKSLRMKVEYTVATYIVVFFPVVVIIGVWILLCWVIIGNPLYFLNSVYSNTAQTAYLSDPLAVGAWQGFRDTLLLVLQKSAPFLTVYGVILGERILTRRVRQPDFWVLTVLIWVQILFHIAMLLTQKSYGWLRFFAYALITSIAWVPHELTGLSKDARRAFAGCCAGALLLSGVVSYQYLGSQSMAPEEYEAFRQSDVSGVANQRAAATRINEMYSDDVILMDSFMTSTLILNVEDPKNLIINTSPQFVKVLDQPWMYGVRYVLVADPAGVGALDAVNLAYPGLYYGGADWCMLAEEMAGFKLFEVLY